MRKRIILAFVGLLLLVSCQKTIENPNLIQEELPTFASGGSSGTTVIDKLKSLAQALLYDARQSSAFKKAIYFECHKEKYDDYYITVKDIISMNDSLQFWNSSRKSYIQSLLNDLYALGQKEPVVFIPFLEDKPITFITNNEFPRGVPIAVLKPEYDSVNATCPGYTLNQSDNLESNQQNINEDYAWVNDVWVIGEEEGTPANDSTIGQSLNQNNAGNTSRFNGQIENGAIIKVTNIDAIESWISGKLEFLYRVHSAGGSVIKNLELPKVKRKDVKNTWKDFGTFIAFWNISNIGNWMIESWAEQDCRGRSCTAITYTVNFPAPCTGCPTTSINFQLKEGDDDMGQTMIQFSDPITTEYQISHAYVKRKN